MELIDAIKKRRSIRKFTGEVIEKELLNQIIEAGFYAPSAHNYRPWEMLVIQDQTSLEKIAHLHPYAKMIPSAGTAVIVLGNRNLQHMEGFIIEDCSAVIQNMLLETTSLGLGSVWCGIYPVKELIEGIQKIFDLPETIIPIGIVAIGHADEYKAPLDRYDPSKVFYEHYRR